MTARIARGNSVAANRHLPVAMRGMSSQRFLLAVVVAVVMFAVTTAPVIRAEVEKVFGAGSAAADDSGCTRIFARNINYVCGSDGRLYINPSIFDYHQCVKRKQGEQLERVAMARCDPDAPKGEL